MNGSTQKAKENQETKWEDVKKWIWKVDGGANFGVVWRVVTQVNGYPERVAIIQRGPIRCAFFPPI